MGVAMCRLLEPIHTRRRTHTHMGVAMCVFLEPILTRKDFVMI